MPDITAIMDGEELYTESDMLNSGRPGDSYPTVQIEGCTDNRIFVKLLAVPEDKLTFRYKGNGGYGALEGALKDANAEGRTNFLALADADLRWNKGEQPPANMIWTDVHDFEMMMLLPPSEALKAVVAELEIRIPPGSGPCPTVADRTEALRKKLLTLALPAARLRSAMSPLTWEVSMDNLPYHKYIDETTWDLRINELVSTVQARASNGCPGFKELKQIACAAQSGEEPYQLCRGHDVTTILALYTRRMSRVATRRSLRTYDGLELKKMTDDIESRLRLSYGRHDFHFTEMHCNIWYWQNKTKLKVLRPCGMDCWVKDIDRFRWCEQ